MTIYEAAISYHLAGLKVIPVSELKAPLVKSWKQWQEGTQSIDEVMEIFKGDPYGIAIISGEVEVIDIDTKNDPDLKIHKLYWDAIIAAGLDTKQFVAQKTMSGGYHFAYKTKTPGRNEPLARYKVGEKFTTVLETRSDGGYFLVSPTPGYELKQGSFEDLKFIDSDDRDSMFAIARSFDQKVQPKPKIFGVSDPTRKSVWQDFNDKNDYTYIVDAIIDQGWQEQSTSGDRIFFVRPGKKRGISGDVNAKLNLFKSFSSNGYPFEQDTAYTPFDVYALLHHNGDGKKAGSVLYHEGYGDRYEVVEPEVNEEASDDGVYTFDPSTPPPNINPCLRHETRYRSYDLASLGDIFTVGGASGSRKSTFLMALIAGALTGKPFLQFPINLDNRDILLFDTEQPPTRLFRQQMNVLKMINSSVLPSRLTVKGIRSLPTQKGVGITTARKNYITSFINNYPRKIGWIVIDNIVDVCKDFNGVEPSQDVMDWIKQIADTTGAMFSPVLHTTKTSGNLRGHLGSMLDQKSDCYLEIKKGDEDGTYSLVRAAKTRGSEFFQPIEFTHENGMPAMYDPMVAMQWAKRNAIKETV